MEGLLLVAVIFFAWYFHSRLNKVSNDLKALRREIGYLKNGAGETGVITPVDTAAVLQTSLPDEHDSYMAVLAPVMPAPTSVPASVPYTAMNAGEDAAYGPAVDNAETERNFEFNIGAKLPVWIGAIALVFAAFYLVKYSIEAGWLQPAVRLTLGGLFGAGLLAAGQWLLDRQHIANAQRMAQGLVGAGLVSLYVCMYAAINLYELVPPTIGFGGMVIVTAIAVIMSLRHGQAIAAFGLFGGLITPALVGSEEPNALVLFTYLFLLFTGVLYMFSRKGWWGLASIALVGMFGWSAMWFATEFSDDDALVLVLFAMGLCGVVLAFTGRRVMQGTDDGTITASGSFHALNFLAVAGGVATMIWLSFIIDLTLFDWSMLGLLTLAGFTLAFFMPQVYQRIVFAKLGADLILFALWTDIPTSYFVAVAIGLGVIYTIVPLLIMKHVRDPRFWAALQLVSSLAVYLISYSQFKHLSSFTQPFDGFWGVTALIVASGAVYLAQMIRLHYTADDKIRDHLLAIYALAATTFISIGLITEVPAAHLALAFAMQGLVTMWIFWRTNIPFLRHIMTGLLTVFLLLNFEQIALLVAIFFTGAVLEPTPQDARDIILSDPLIRLGLPALLWGGVLYMYAQMPDRRSLLMHLLIGTIGFLISMTGYYLIKDGLHSEAQYMEIVSGFLERGLFTFLIAGAGAGLFLLSQKKPAVAYFRTWGVFLFNLAMVRIVYFDLMIANPYFNGSQFVGDWPLLNGVTLVYGGGLLMSVWAIRTPDLYKGSTGVRKIHKLIGFCLLFALVSLSIRQLFHGGYVVEGAMENIEFYAYSIVWLVTGLGLLGYGIVKDSKTARMASLLFMLLTIGKVFFFDAGELQGLYRVFSFLGLGFSLMGLSYFYSRYFLKKSP